MRLLMPVLLTLAALTSTASPCAAQRDSVLAHRWVGKHLGRPLFLEFYGDSMLVVNDRHALDYRLTNDSLIAVGDTTVIGRYRLARGWLLLATPDGVVTMAPQPFEARPLTGRWIGPLGTPDDVIVDLRLYANGVAQWRPTSGGPWTVGEWERTFRIVTFTWETEADSAAGPEPPRERGEGEEEEEPDGSEWRALYDPVANALLFEVTVPEAETTIFRRRFR